MRLLNRNKEIMRAAGIMALLGALLLWGCDSNGPATEKKEEPAVTNTLPFSAMSPFLSVSPETTGSVEIWGGTTPYSIQSISDSLKIYAGSAGIAVRDGKYFLDVRGKAKGTATIVVKDAGGKNQIPVEVRVQSFTAIPAAVTLAVSEATEIRLRSGIRPYAIVQPPGSQVATATLSDTVIFLFALGFGSTGVTIRDQNGAGDSISVPVTVTKTFGVFGGGTIIAGATIIDSISGGVAPYRLYSYDDSKVTATINGASLSITAAGSAAGSTIVVITDNSIPRRLLSLPVSIVSPLSLSPASISIAEGTSIMVNIAGGTVPYSITSQPAGSIATASIAGSTLTVTGLSAGTTTVKIGDASSPVQTKSLAVAITSSNGFTTAGTLSFSYASSSGQSAPFAANGIFYNVRAGNSGAGAFSYPGSPSKLIIYAYKDFSQVSADIVSLTVTNTSAVATGDYPFASTAAKNAAGFYKINANLNDTSHMGYMFSSGTLTVTSSNGIAIAGTFSGGAYDILNNVTTITITNGQFSVPIISGTNGSAMDRKVRNVILKSLR